MKRHPKEGVPFSRTLDVDGADYSLTVSGGSDCGIPADAVFTAAALQDTDENYVLYRDRASAAVSGENTTILGLFDLSIHDAEGRHIQPDAPVNVSFHFADDPDEGTEIYAVHFPGTSLPSTDFIAEDAEAAFIAEDADDSEAEMPDKKDTDESCVREQKASESRNPSGSRKHSGSSSQEYRRDCFE